MATGGATPPDEEPNKLTCAVCLEQYRRPKLLPCFHTFCQGCLQTVAGTSPSFPCPACRTIVILPPGGVPALQTNFYIEEDENVQSTPPARLCDVCIQDKEATHFCLQCQQRYCSPCRKVHDSIASCRAHSVVPLQSGSPGGDGRQGRPEELCPQHKSRAVVLHCVPCRANICLQCKKTAHEGHTVEDLQDTGSKVKARLQQRLQTLNHQTSQLQGVLAAVKNRRDVLVALHDSTEKGIKDRVRKAHQLVDECQDNTLGSLEILHQGLLKSLSGTGDGLQHSLAALTAQAEHIIRVLREDKDTDIVDLEARLTDVSLDQEKMAQTLMRLQSASEPYVCEHNPVATSTAQLQAFVGMVKRSEEKNTVSDSEAATSALDTSLTSVIAASAAVSRPAAQSASVVEVVYSRNPSSTVAAMCTTSEKRVWIKYKPSGEGQVMALFGSQGLLKGIGTTLFRNAMVTVLTDTTIGFDLGNKLHWVKTDGLTGKIQTNFGFINSTAKTSWKDSVYGVGNNECCQFHMTSLNSSQCKKTVVHSEGELAPLKDVSRCERYFVFSKGSSAHLYLKDQSGGLLRRISTYCPAPKQRILDACFFPVGDREMLLVVVEGDNQVHVVDHTGGCCFVQYLDTGHLTLQNPRLLATDQETVLWVACHGGKLLMMQV